MTGEQWEWEKEQFFRFQSIWNYMFCEINYQIVSVSLGFRWFITFCLDLDLLICRCVSFSSKTRSSFVQSATKKIVLRRSCFLFDFFVHYYYYCYMINSDRRSFRSIEKKLIFFPLRFIYLYRSTKNNAVKKKEWKCRKKKSLTKNIHNNWNNQACIRYPRSLQFGYMSSWLQRRE